MPLLTVPPVRCDLGNGHFMVSHAEVDTDNGHVMGHTDMTVTNKVTGFTGGAQLLYLNDLHQTIGTSGVQQIGLGQAPLFGAAHRSYDWENLTAPPAETAGIALAQFWDPHNRFGDVGQALEKFFNDTGNWLLGAANAGLQFLQDNPEVAIGLVIAVVAVVIVASGGLAAPECVVALGGIVCTF